MIRAVDHLKKDSRKRRSKACITCKIRRVRCDLGRPSCQRCLSTGRKCDGYPAPIPSEPQETAPVAVLVVMEHPVPSKCDHEVVASFQFFVQVCAPSLLNFGSQRFWNELVLQACFVDESIKHLIIAASRLGWHRVIEEDAEERPPENDTLFLSHYGKALKLLSQARDPDPAFLLMACLLLILCDEFRHNAFAALQHIIAGRNILATYEPKSVVREDTAIREIGLIFAKLETQTGELYSQVRPLPHTWPSFAQRRSWLEGDIQHFATPLDNKDDHKDFKSIDKAAQSLQAIAVECMSHQIPGPPPSTRFHTVPTLTNQLNSWLDQYILLERSMRSLSSSVIVTSLYLLRNYHMCITLLSRCEPFGQEAAFDSYAGNFEHIMVTAGFLIRTTKIRIIPILFFVATRYRNASIRRRAIEMLKQCGLDGQILAKIALKVVRIEEKVVGNPIVCSDIPESARIRLINLVFDTDGAAYVLRFKRKPYGDDTAVETISIPAPALPWNSEPQTPVHAVSGPSPWKPLADRSEC